MRFKASRSSAAGSTASAKRQGRITDLTVDQITRLVECAKADGNAQIYLFIVIGLETARRKSEILSIRREDMDVQRRVVFIPKAKARAREQPITERRRA